MSTTPTPHLLAAVPVGVMGSALAEPPATTAFPVVVATALEVPCCHAMNMVGHPCLAVLTAATALTMTLIVLFAGRTPAWSAFVLRILNALGGRAPPGGCRLAHLCVLRC